MANLPWRPSHVRTLARLAGALTANDDVEAATTPAREAIALGRPLLTDGRRGRADFDQILGDTVRGLVYAGSIVDAGGNRVEAFTVLTDAYQATAGAQTGTSNLLEFIYSHLCQRSVGPRDLPSI